MERIPDIHVTEKHLQPAMQRPRGAVVSPTDMIPASFPNYYLLSSSPHRHAVPALVGHTERVPAELRGNL